MFNFSSNEGLNGVNLKPQNDQKFNSCRKKLKVKEKNSSYDLSFESVKNSCLDFLCLVSSSCTEKKSSWPRPFWIRDYPASSGFLLLSPRRTNKERGTTTASIHSGQTQKATSHPVFQSLEV